MESLLGRTRRHDDDAHRKAFVVLRPKWCEWQESTPRSPHSAPVSVVDAELTPLMGNGRRRMDDMQTPRGRVLWMLGAAASLLLVVHTLPAAGQGLISDRQALGSSMVSSRALLTQYAAARTQAAAWLNSAANSARTACRSSGSSGGRARLCAAQAITTSAAAVDKAALLLAVGPKTFDGRLLNLHGPVGDQGKCASCVPFALAAAAEAVATKALGLPGGSVSLSEQDIGFCPVDQANSKYCPTGMSLSSTIGRLKQPVVPKNCLPYTIAPGSDDPSTLCDYACKDPSDIYQKGSFRSFSLTESIPEIQAAIRKHGAVVTRLNVYAQLRPFFAANPTGVYSGQDCDLAKPIQEEHAIVLVGYDNNKEFWVARNSWGPGFADSGYFRIKYGVCGVGAVGFTFGLAFTLNSPATTTLRVAPDPDQAGCFVYRATNADTIWSLADRLDVDAVQLLANNSAAITDPTAPLGGRLITLCAAGPQSRITLSSVGGSRAPTPAPAPTPATAAARPRAREPAPAPVPTPSQPIPVPSTLPTTPSAPAPAPTGTGGGVGGSGGGFPFLPGTTVGAPTTSGGFVPGFGTGGFGTGGGIPGFGFGRRLLQQQAAGGMQD